MSWFSDFVDSVREAFSGGSSSQSDSGSMIERHLALSPQQRPSIMTVQRQPEDDRQLVATRDMPRFGISEGQSESVPDYSPLSIQGLTSTDPGNVMRNIQGAERMARAMPADSGRDDSPAPVQAAAPASAAAPAQAASAATELTSVADQEAQIEEAGETAAARARRLGLASTIATSPSGLLAGGEGTTRRRRSLMGGGLIA
jgi:hypothetical protein